MQLDRTALRQLPRDVQIELEENIQREDLSQSELAIIQGRLLNILRDQSQQGVRTDLTTSENRFSQDNRAPAIVGKLFGESHKPVEWRQRILKAAADDPVTYGHLPALMDSKGHVKPVFKQLVMLERQQAHAQRVERGCTVANLHELVERGQRCGVIYPDCPWPEEVNGHYTTMSINDMVELPVPQLAAEHCALILPTTKAARMNGWAPELIRRWGFELVDDELFHWIKQTRSGDGLFIGRGQSPNSPNICVGVRDADPGFPTAITRDQLPGTNYRGFIHPITHACPPVLKHPHVHTHLPALTPCVPLSRRLCQHSSPGCFVGALRGYTIEANVSLLRGG
jgi:hypothetical protein